MLVSRLLRLVDEDKSLGPWTCSLRNGEDTPVLNSGNNKEAHWSFLGYSVPGGYLYSSRTDLVSLLPIISCCKRHSLLWVGNGEPRGRSQPEESRPQRTPWTDPWACIPRSSEMDRGEFTMWEKALAKSWIRRLRYPMYIRNTKTLQPLVRMANRLVCKWKLSSISWLTCCETNDASLGA